MQVQANNSEVYETLKNLSSDYRYSFKEAAIILAAGHGKRIKSNTSKMLHKIWEVPTVERVYNACKEGIENINLIVVVGIKATDVMNVIGKRENTLFAYQEEQNGTGHAVQVALKSIDASRFDGIVYVLPGDMGLIDKETVQMFRSEFIKSGSDMMVLTGIYEGDPALNYYGRIIRVKETDIEGNAAGKDFGKVIEIMEHKDILHLEDDKPYIRTFNGRQYCYSKKELIENNEFNSGVYAFDFKKLDELSKKLSSNNVQKEIYITDLIYLFNNNGYSVNAVYPKEQHVLMGFNNKSVLMEMETIAREKAYEKLKDIIEIDDPNDFFVHETLIDEIIEMDKKGIPLDIRLGKGVYIGKGVKLNYNLILKKNAFIESNVSFGKNVTVCENTKISCLPNQTLKIGDNTEILWDNNIKGNTTIGSNCRIESGVNITGSDEYPCSIGNNVLIKGTSYIFGSAIDDELYIEHCILLKKKVNRISGKDGAVQKIRFYSPLPEGVEALKDID